MNKVSETDKLLANVICEIESKHPDGPRLHEALGNAAERLGMDRDDLPDEAYEAAALFVRLEITKLAAEAVRKMDGLLETLRKLPARVTPSEIEKIKQEAEEVRLPYMFTAALSKTAIDGADFDYLAERAVEASRKAAEKIAKV